MSRSGYSDDFDGWSLITYRGQVASAIRGKRGQALMLDIVRALDALPEKKLVQDSLVSEGGYCTLGAVGLVRGIDIVVLDPDDIETVSGVFDVAEQLAREVVYMNDEGAYRETPEQRWQRMRDWAVSNLKPVDLVDAE